MGDEKHEPSEREPAATDEPDDLELEEVDADNVAGGAARRPFPG